MPTSDVIETSLGSAILGPPVMPEATAFIAPMKQAE